MPNGAWWEDASASVEDLASEMGAAAVDAAVLVQASGPHGTDNSYMEASARTDPTRFAGVCTVDALAPDAVQQLTRLGGLPHIHGVRLFHIFPEVAWLDEQPGADLVTAATELGLTVGVCIQAHDLGRLRNLLSAHGDLVVVLDHCGLVDFAVPDSPEVLELWRALDHPGLHLKFTPTVAAATSESDGPEALLAELVARAGAERVVWGSDWPQHRQESTSATMPYAHTVEWLRRCVLPLDSAAQRAVMGANARRLWPEAWLATTVRA
jgi:predicted TIM-barrel fold metal-dependent hydrolase